MDLDLRNMLSDLKTVYKSCRLFLEGPCKYCGICSYPEPCRFPDMQVFSVSTLGLDLTKLFKENGKTIVFRDGSFTLYGFMFISVEP